MQLFLLPTYAETTESSQKISINISSEVTLKIQSKVFSLLGYTVDYDKTYASVTILNQTKADEIEFRIQGVKKGVTALILKNPFKTLKYEINVKEPVHSININETINTLEVNDSVFLSCNILPNSATNKDVFWMSSNPNIISVDNRGNATAKKRGEANITCFSIDNAQKYDDLHIKVVSEAKSISSTDYYGCIGESITPQIEIKPEQYELKYEFQIISNENDAIKLEDGVIKCKNVGSAVIKASISNKDISCYFKVNVFYTKPSKKQIKLYNELISFKGFNELNVCQKFIKEIYNNAFDTESYSATSALEAGSMWCTNNFDYEDLYKIPVGAVIYADCGEYGHVGYYDGQGNVIHQNDGCKKITELKEFISYFHAYGWGWQNGDNLTKI